MGVVVDSPAGHHRVEVATTAARQATDAAQLFAAGAIGVWEQADTLVAWFDQRPRSLGELDQRATWRFEPDRDWQSEWKATIEPVRAGRFLIVPSWRANEAAHQPSDTKTIVLDPGRAFGSGHHATTTMCLELIGDLADQQRGATASPLQGLSFADVGCGSGILAIAAAQLGADATAVDIDDAAVAVTKENATANQVTVTATRGSASSCSPCDIVAANLLTDVIVDLADDLAAITRQHLIVSGIAEQRSTVARDALRQRGMVEVMTRTRDGWYAGCYQPSSGS
ncbi:MAG: 50S ribosomal protein L11 methyltransferase [Nitriliruptoraceae bacterium]